MHEDGTDLVFDHMYVERRMTPLNLYLRDAGNEAAERAALDYGQCIRDLAYTDIFPGDLLLKNFGVTRHGRVIFYDYDELCRVTDCNFRDLPQAQNPEDEMRGEAWFYVAENDVFPETFMRFLAFGEGERAALLRAHAEILTAKFWREVQQRLREGEVLEALPYHPTACGSRAAAERSAVSPVPHRDWLRQRSFNLILQRPLSLVMKPPRKAEVDAAAGPGVSGPGRERRWRRDGGEFGAAVIAAIGGVGNLQPQ